jgi:hypothetical protein
MVNIILSEADLRVIFAALAMPDISGAEQEAVVQARRKIAATLDDIEQRRQEVRRG